MVAAPSCAMITRYLGPLSGAICCPADRKKELVKQTDGYADGKHAPTYGGAARTAGGEPKLLYALLENVMALAR